MAWPPVFKEQMGCIRVESGNMVGSGHRKYALHTRDKHTIDNQNQQCYL